MYDNFPPFQLLAHCCFSKKKNSMTIISENDQFPSSCGVDGNSRSLPIGNSPHKKRRLRKNLKKLASLIESVKLLDALIVQIHSGCFRPTILYKHWQYFWTSIDNLVYDNKLKSIFIQMTRWYTNSFS